jgi:hypothetical protein
MLNGVAGLLCFAGRCPVLRMVLLRGTGGSESSDPIPLMAQSVAGHSSYLAHVRLAVCNIVVVTVQQRRRNACYLYGCLIYQRCVLCLGCCPACWAAPVRPWAGMVCSWVLFFFSAVGNPPHPPTCHHRHRFAGESLSAMRQNQGSAVGQQRHQGSAVGQQRHQGSAAPLAHYTCMTAPIACTGCR